MSTELVLFVIVAAVAIFAAAFMLVSRNPVHSALFLVINFMCVAFFYLMLSAPFLAMIQVTVYAGAIMVLFMFVIMLLGAEKLGGKPGKYSWMVPAAVGLTTVFLIVAFVAIVQSNVGLLKPVPIAPQVKFIHTAAGAPAVDIYLNNDQVAQKVSYDAATDFVEAKSGDYNLLVFPSCTETDPTKCVDPIKSGAAPTLAQSITLKDNTSTAFIIAGTPDQLQVITAPLDLGTVDDENTLRVTTVNALPNTSPVNVLNIDPSDPANPSVMVPALAYGAVAQAAILPKGTYTFGWQRGTDRLFTLRDVPLRGKTNELLILTGEIVTAQATPRPAVFRLDPPLRTDEAYGSPQQIGLSLLSTYLLPFELVSLLLLAAMVGAIILTREETIKRERKRLVVSPAIRRMKHAISNPQTSPNPANMTATEPAESTGD